MNWFKKKLGKTRDEDGCPIRDIPITTDCQVKIQQQPIEKHDFDKVEDKIKATIYGNCIGDAIGILTEFFNKKTSVETYGKYENIEYEHKVNDLHRQRWKNGDWTDDSDQMILIMDSLVDCEGKIDKVDYAKKLYLWTRKGFPELGDYAGMGIGATTVKVVNHGDFMSDPHKASAYIWDKTGRVVAPNGGVMRTSILGVYQYEDLQKVVDNTLAICKVTHIDPRCQASTIAVTTAIAFMLRAESKHLLENGDYNTKTIMEDAFQIASKCFDENSIGREYKEEFHKHMFAKSLSDLKLDDKAGIGYTLKCMGAGFWAFRQNDFRDALQKLILEGGDADTNGAVAGALLGCKLGTKNLPETWLNGLFHKKWLDEKIDRFLNLMYPGCKPQPASVTESLEKASAEKMDTRDNVQAESKMSETAENLDSATKPETPEKLETDQ